MLVGDAVEVAVPGQRVPLGTHSAMAGRMVLWAAVRVGTWWEVDVSVRVSVVGSPVLLVSMGAAEVEEISGEVVELDSGDAWKTMAGENVRASVDVAMGSEESAVGYVTIDVVWLVSGSSSQ